MTSICEHLKERIAEAGAQAIAHDGPAQEHLEGCEGCFSFLEAIYEVDAGLKSLPTLDAPQDLVEHLFERVERGDAPRPDEQPWSMPPRRPPLLDALRRHYGQLAAGLSAGALVVVLVAVVVGGEKEARMPATRPQSRPDLELAKQKLSLEKEKLELERQKLSLEAEKRPAPEENPPEHAEAKRTKKKRSGKKRRRIEPEPKPEPVSKPSRPLTTEEALLAGAGRPEEDPGLPRTLPEDEIFGVLRRHKKDIKRCADQHKGPGGVLTVKLVIKKNGRTSGVHGTPSALAASTGGQCVLAAVKKFRFGKFSGSNIPLDFPVRLPNK